MELSAGRSVDEAGRALSWTRRGSSASRRDGLRTARCTCSRRRCRTASRGRATSGRTTQRRCERGEKAGRPERGQSTFCSPRRAHSRRRKGLKALGKRREEERRGEKRREEERRTVPGASSSSQGGRDSRSPSGRPCVEEGARQRSSAARATAGARSGVKEGGWSGTQRERARTPGCRR